MRLIGVRLIGVRTPISLILWPCIGVARGVFCGVEEQYRPDVGKR